MKAKMEKKTNQSSKFYGQLLISFEKIYLQPSLRHLNNPLSTAEIIQEHIRITREINISDKHNEKMG